MAAAAVVTIVAAWALAASSGVPVRWHADDAAELRLSWSGRPERIETCRMLSEDELAQRPAHMRRSMECEGRSATYDLRVSADGVMLDSLVVRGSGARGDRPAFVLRRYQLEPGMRRVRVTLARREPVDPAADTAPATTSTLARHVALDTAIAVEAGAVVLVTYDAGRFHATFARPAPSNEVSSFGRDSCAPHLLLSRNRPSRPSRLSSSY